MDSPRLDSSYVLESGVGTLLSHAFVKIWKPVLLTSNHFVFGNDHSPRTSNMCFVYYWFRFFSILSLGSVDSPRLSYFRFCLEIWSWDFLFPTCFTLLSLLVEVSAPYGKAV